MLRDVVKMILRIAGIRSEDRFGDDWTGRAIVGMTARMSWRFLRGMLRRPFFGSSKGMLLIGKGVLIRFPGHLHVGRNFIAEDHCEIHAHSRRGVVLGDKVTIGSFALIRPTNYYGGALGEGLRVGNNSNIGPYCYIGCSGYIEIGDNVMISPRVSFYGENHNHVAVDVPMKEQGITRDAIIIEDDCWIASHSVILAGVRIGRGSIVAAGSVVTRDVPPFSIVGGVPASVIRSRKPSVRPAKPSKRKR